MEEVFPHFGGSVGPKARCTCSPQSYDVASRCFVVGFAGESVNSVKLPEMQRNEWEHIVVIGVCGGGRPKRPEVPTFDCICAVL